MDIPEEAVEAAAKVVLQYIDLQLIEHDQERKIPNEAAREILEAAAPHMLGDAWDAGGEAAIEREHTYGAEEKAKFSNPYRSQA